LCAIPSRPTVPTICTLVTPLLGSPANPTPRLLSKRRLSLLPCRTVIWRQFYLGLTKNTPDSGGPASVFLYGDAAGSPDIATQTLLGTVAPTEVFGTTNKSLVSLPATGRVLVVKGRDYWVVLKPAAQAVDGTWNRSLPEVKGSNAWSEDDVTWETSNDTLPAFRITAWPPPWSKFFRPRESPSRAP
jgi:hypothetical protein